MNSYLLKQCLKNKDIVNIQNKFKLSSEQIALLYEAYMFEESLELYSRKKARFRNIGSMFYNTNVTLIMQGYDPTLYNNLSEYWNSIKYNKPLLEKLRSNKFNRYTEVPVEQLTSEELDVLLRDLEKEIC